MTDLLLIADDLTGAADAGAPFAAAGFTTAIPFDRPRREAADVLCLSTNSRDVPATEAESRVREALRAVCGIDGSLRPPWLMKKMDSALRGHPAEELLTVMRLSQIPRAIVAPAIPGQGRTTIGGVVFDRGVRLTETPFGGEQGHDNLARLFERSPQVAVRTIDLPSVRGSVDGLRAVLSVPGSWIGIADAETGDDLDRVASVGIEAGIRLFCGAAGLAGVLARRLSIQHVHQPPAIRRRNRPVLVIAGSRHPVTASQIAVAVDAGAELIRLDQSALDHAAPDQSPYHCLILASLRAGRTTIVTTAGLEQSSLEGMEVAERLAAAAIPPGVPGQIGGLVLTGGDVAAAVCRVLAVRTIWMRGEVLPAIPWATIAGARADGLPVVTKAGSFGAPDAIQQAIEFLNQLPVTRKS